MAMVDQEELTSNNVEDENHISEEEEDDTSSRPSSESLRSKQSTPGIMPQHQYSKEELMKISKLPLSLKRPSCLNPAHNNSSGKWDPERWFVNKRGDKPHAVEETRSKRERQDIDIGLSHKRRTGDPKERIKEEKDEIVLSPQRRSFGTGCHVIPQSSLAKRPGSPVDMRDGDNFRETRRIGSGRIMNREREQRDWDRDHREYSYNGTRGDRRDRFDSEDNEKEVRRYSSRYSRGERRVRGHERIEEEEPEWFSGGPTSQSETIELVGFDDTSNDEDVKKSSRKSKRNRENARRQSMKSEVTEKSEPPVPTQEEKSSAQKAQKENSSETVTKVKENSKPNSPELPPSVSPENSKNVNPNFDLDELFRMEWIPGLLSNEIPAENASSEITCSRFTQWFKRESPELELQISGQNSRRSSLQDEIIAQVLGGIGEPQLLIPSPTLSSSENYFAPISPALSSPNCSLSSQHPVVCSESSNIIEMLHSASNSCGNGLVNGERNGTEQSSVKSVEELEADLKRIVLGDNKLNENKSQEDRSAFEKLLQHMQDSTPASISMGPLDKSKALQEDELLQNLLGQNSCRSPSLPQSLTVREERSDAVQLGHSGHVHLQYSNQTSQLPSNDVYSQLFPSQRQQQQQQAMQMKQLQSQQRQIQQQQLQHQQQLQQQQHLQQQQQLQSQFLSQKQGINVQGFTVDMLAKILESQAPLSPVAGGMHQTGSVSFNRNDSQALNAMQQQQKRDLLTTMLKQQQTMQPHAQPPMIHQRPATKEIGTNAVTKTLGLPTLGVSPRQSPLPTESINCAVANQGRIPSPLVFGQQPPALSHAPAPIHPAHLAQAVAQNASSSNTLQVQNTVVLQRVPSPQELAVHTQSILQNALIKRKLEEQKENFRKRQEAQRTNSPVTSNGKNVNSTSPLKGMSPTIPFTPTSVMRKMHSEKSENTQPKNEVIFQNGGNKNLVCAENRSSDTDQNMVNRNSTNMHSSAANSMFSSSSNNVSAHHSGNTIAPRPVYGQSVMNNPRPQHVSNAAILNSSAGSIVVSNHGQGRAIVKGGNGHANIHACNDISRTVIANKNIATNKHFIPGANQYAAIHPESDMTMETLNKLLEQQQQRLLHQKSVALLGQRRQSTSPMPPMHTAAAYAFSPRGPANLPNPNMVRPMGLGRAAVAAAPNFPLLRTMMQTNPTLRATPSCSINSLTALGQLAALQQQIQRGVGDNRQIQAASRNYSPLALQQLLLSSQGQVAAQSQVAAGFSGAHGDGKHHLHPGQPSTHRQSPVNLARWFGNEVLKQKMPEMPPVSHQKALRLEDVERQQQHSTAVHN